MEKGLAGWEVMEVFAGGVAESDGVFSVSTMHDVCQRTWSN